LNSYELGSEEAVSTHRDHHHSAQVLFIRPSQPSSNGERLKASAIPIKYNEKNPLFMEQSALAFLGTVVLISLSGVLVPGPNMAVVISRGAMDRLAGTRVSLGHAFAELPLICAVFLGVDALDNDTLLTAVAILGGAVLIYTGIKTINNPDRSPNPSASGGHSTATLGFMTSVSNPYWWLWWATVGATLIATGVSFGLWMLPLFAATHISVDLICYQTISSLMSAASGKADSRWIKLAALIGGGIMLLFGIYFLGDGVMTFLTLT